MWQSPTSWQADFPSRVRDGSASDTEAIKSAADTLNARFDGVSDGNDYVLIGRSVDRGRFQRGCAIDDRIPSLRRGVGHDDTPGSARVAGGLKRVNEVCRCGVSMELNLKLAC